jgi:hypothetical protein
MLQLVAIRLRRRSASDGKLNRFVDGGEAGYHFGGTNGTTPSFLNSGDKRTTAERPGKELRDSLPIFEVE